MPISIDGQSLIITDCDITVPNAFDPVTGVATIIITPSGGVANIPALIQGLPGLDSPPRTVTVTQVAPGGVLPDPVVNIVTPGGAGTRTIWDLSFSVYSGAAGADAVLNILSALDLTGPLIDEYMLTYNSAGNVVMWAPQKCGGLHTPAAISTTSSTTTSPRVLAAVNIASYPFDWWPIVHAEVSVSSSAADTHVDLVARLNNATSGDQVGFGTGVTGIAPPPIRIDGTGYGDVLTADYGKVFAGSAAIVYLVAVQTGPSGNSWSTGAASMMIEVKPVP